MRKTLCLLLLVIFIFQNAQAQQHINKKELELMKKHLEKNSLLKEDDDFNTSINSNKWSNESAVILAHKTSFDFDKKGVSVGARIGRNIWALVFALPTFGTSFLFANSNNETKILIEEKERRKILLKDKYAIEEYSVLYFRLAAEGDAFAARVIKKDGSIQNLDIADAIRVENIKLVPDLFRSYTDGRFTAFYRPDFFKLAVSDLEEGDIIEYEFTNFNSQRYAQNIDYKEFDPVYYLCNRIIPVEKQIIEVVAEDDNYYITNKSLKAAPEFQQTEKNGKRIFRWVDQDRERMADARFLNRLTELPSIKFQVVYARTNRKNFVWFKDEQTMKEDISAEKLGEKAKIFWFQPQKLQNTGSYMAGLRTDLSSTVKTLYKSLKKKGITDASDEEYVHKAYYFIRSKTLYNNWSDFAFAKVFSELLEQKKIPHDIIVTTNNNLTDLIKVSFAQELSWLVRYNGKFYANPNDHLNPEELPVSLSNNQAISFIDDNEKAEPIKELLPSSDTLANLYHTLINASLDASKVNLLVEKNTETKGFLRDDINDDVLALTPYIENDYKNYDGTSMFEGLDSKAEDKAISDFNATKKEWKEEKPKMMKSLAESDYGFKVTSYNNFRLLQDGRSYKKRNLQYAESFTLEDFTANAGVDLVVPLAKLVGEQTKIKKEERTRTLPIDARYARTLKWTIIFNVPSGYTVQGLDNLTRNINNECGTFISSAKVVGSTLTVEVKKVVKAKNFDARQWPFMLEVLDAGYNFSQAKIILKKI